MKMSKATIIKERPDPHTSRAAEVGDRPVQRTPVAGGRDILTIRGYNPNYEYRWVLDTSESGQRIWKFREASYTFVEAHELQGVGHNRVMKTESLGSIVVMPSGGGSTLYLMKIPKELYAADQEAKHALVDQEEKEMFRSKIKEAGGSGKVSHEIT